MYVGHSPSEAFNETVEEATQSLYPLIGERGMDWMYSNCSTTAQRGALDWWRPFHEASKPVFEKCMNLSRMVPRLLVPWTATPSLTTVRDSRKSWLKSVNPKSGVQARPSVSSDPRTSARTRQKERTPFISSFPHPMCLFIFFFFHVQCLFLQIAKSKSMCTSALF